MIALRPQEMPDRRDWIVWSLARTVDVEPDRRRRHASVSDVRCSVSAKQCTFGFPVNSVHIKVAYVYKISSSSFLHTQRIRSR